MILINILSNRKMKHEILLGLTTTPASDWRGKVEEMKKFGIKRIALFPTFLGVKDRKELYDLLDEIEGLQIPHVHLRGQDMHDWEMKWFEKHGAKVYNIHMGAHVKSLQVLATYNGKIFVENHTHKSIPEDQLEGAGGICLDFQHWERAKKSNPSVAEKTLQYAKKFKVGCCHVSALPKWKNVLQRMVKRVGGHYMVSLDEMDYMLGFKRYLPQYVSLELENTFERQLEVKEYLEKILK